VEVISKSSLCLNSEFATTRKLVTEPPVGLQILPSNASRKGQGGLRTRGYYKTNHPDNPLITIITVGSNDNTHIEQTILNVIHLPYDNIEYIIIDGGSADGTNDTLKDYDGCIDYWVSEPDGGLYDAMNKGWRVVSCEGAILFLGAGDKILRLPGDCNALEKQQVIFGRVQLGTSRIFKSRINWTLKLANTLHHQALLIPKALHIEPPFDTRYRVYADFDFNLRLMKKGVHWHYDKDFLAYALPGGASQVYSSEAYIIARKNYGLIFGALAYLFYLYQKSKNLLRFFDFYRKNC
jgi:glycosyltransferase involved in cell wall biosynthesis